VAQALIAVGAVDVGTADEIRDGAVRGELGLLSYLQTAHGGLA
jgi:hypothetical protein